jgi:hypothetical protein
MLWLSSKANPILPETTDCIQSTDHLHAKPDLLAHLDSSVKRVAQDYVLGYSQPVLSKLAFLIG